MQRSGVRFWLCCAVPVMLCAVLGFAQFRSHGGPPWQRPVASSQTLHIGGATIQVDFGPGTFVLPQDKILQWVKNAASSVSVYYGRFPVARDRILIEPAPG